MKGRGKIANGLIRVNEFYRLVPDGQKADLIDGVIYMASPDKPAANELIGLIYRLVADYNGARRLGGRVFVNRAAFRLSKLRAPEPDVAFVSKKRCHLIGTREMRGGPDVAVEVVSHDSRKRDYDDKKQIYEAAGVTEYWIIDPLKKRVDFNRLRKEKYALVPLESGHIFRSRVLPGFWLDVNWLFANPLPDAYDCLPKLLSEDAP